MQSIVVVNAGLGLAFLASLVAVIAWAIKTSHRDYPLTAAVQHVLAYRQVEPAVQSVRLAARSRGIAEHGRGAAEGTLVAAQSE